jgi:predicted enzyme related to lactoylglutathione lyase
MTDFLSCRPNLEVRELAPTTEFLRNVLNFEMDLHEPEMGLSLLHRGAVGLAVVRTGRPAVNETTALYIAVRGVTELHEHCVERGATMIAGLSDHPWGMRDFVVQIPGGHRLAIGEQIDKG